MNELRWTLGGVAIVVVILLSAWLLTAHAQTPDAQALIVASPDSGSGLSGKGGDITWPIAISWMVSQLLSRGERLLERVIGFAERWLDKTHGAFPIKLKVSMIHVNADRDPEPTAEMPVRWRDPNGSED